MSDAVSALFQKLIDIINVLKGPIFVALSIIGALYLSGTNFLGIHKLLNSYPGLPAILLIIWILAGVLWSFDLIGKLGRYIASSIDNRSQRREAQEKLRYGLTAQQKRDMYCLLQPDQSRHYFQRSPEMEDLEASDIVTLTDLPEPGSQRGLSWTHYLYVLQPWARRYIKRYPDLMQELQQESQEQWQWK